MAYAERYVRADAAGGGDGTTNTNSGVNGAWTLAEGIANEAAGMRLNVLAGTYASTTTTRTFAAVGTTTAPIWWRGFKATIGDQDANNVAVAGTDIPSLTFTTGQMVVSGAHHIFSSLDITGACTTAGGQVTWSGTAGDMHGVRITNTAVNSAGRALTTFSGASGLSCVRCYFTTAATTVDRIINNGAASLNLYGCVFDGGTLGILVSSSATLAFCAFYNQSSDAIFVTGTTALISNCSFYAPTGNGVNVASPAAGIIVANCYFENVNQAAKAAINNTSGTNTNLIRCIGNSYYNCTANTSGLGDSPLIYDNGTLGSAGFVAPGSKNFALNSVAKALGFPGLFENTSVYQGYLDPGAVQRQEPVGGGNLINQGEY